MGKGEGTCTGAHWKMPEDSADRDWRMGGALSTDA